MQQFGSVCCRDRRTTDLAIDAGVSSRGGGKGVRNANRNECSRGRSLLHRQDMGKTQNHKNSIELRLAAAGGWQLVAGGWWLVVVGGWRLGAIGGPWGLS